jgi:hypothetical protein
LQIFIKISQFRSLFQLLAVLIIILLHIAERLTNIPQQLLRVWHLLIGLLLCIHQRIDLAHSLIYLQCHADRIRNLRGILDAHTDQLFQVVEFIDVSLSDVLDLLVFIAFVNKLYDAVGFAVFTVDCPDYEVFYLRCRRLVVNLADKISFLICGIRPVDTARAKHNT